MLGRVLPLVLIAGVVAAVAHLPALAGGYVLDDGALLVNNPFVRDLDGLVQLLSSEFFAASGDSRNAPYYRPVSGALYWLSYQVLGSNAMLQHGLNLALHAAVVVQVTLIVLRVTAQRRVWATLVSVSAALAVHPASPEIVAYVGGRQELLGWNIVLLAFWLALRFELQGSRLVALAFACCTASSFTREFFLASPLLLLPLAALETTRRKQHALAIMSGGALAWLAVFGLRHSLGVSGFELDLLATPNVVGVMGAIVVRLIQVVFWPVDVAVEVTPTSLGAWSAASILLALATLTGWSLRRYWKRPQVLLLTSLGWACWWSTIVLHVPVVLEFDLLSDRYAYAVLVGVAALLSAVGQVLPPLASKRLHGAAAIGGALLVLCLIPLCWARSAEWRNERSLQAAMYARRPTDPHSQLAEGLRQFAERRYDAAYTHCQAFHQALPHSDRAGLCLGSVLLMRGHASEAARHLEHYAFARPSSLRARVTLFRAWFAANDLQGVERGLSYYTSQLGTAPDLQAAQTELERRRR